MDIQNELKNEYIETCIRIETMQNEARNAAMEWRKMLNVAFEHRRKLLNRIKNYEKEQERLIHEPMLPFADNDENETTNDEKEQA